MKTELDVPVFLQHNRLTGVDFGEIPVAGSFVCRIHQLPLPAATYPIDFSLVADDGRGEYLDQLEYAADLTVVEGNFYGTGEAPRNSHGVCLVAGEWRIEKTAASHVEVSSSSRTESF